MNAIRTNSALKAGLFLAVLLSWFAFSNRCALGLLLSSAEAAAVQHQCCEKKDAPVQHPASKGTLECCKAFHAVAQEGAKTPVLETFAIALVVAFGSDLSAVPREDGTRLDTGPPAAQSFAELVLHRSLRSHAPPLVS